MTDLEERLTGKDGEAELSTLIAQLDQIAQRLQSELRAGLPPEEFSQWQVCWSAVSNAVTELRALQEKC